MLCRGPSPEASAPNTAFNSAWASTLFHRRGPRWESNVVQHFKFVIPFQQIFHILSAHHKLSFYSSPYVLTHLLSLDIFRAMLNLSVTIRCSSGSSWALPQRYFTICVLCSTSEYQTCWCNFFSPLQWAWKLSCNNLHLITVQVQHFQLVLTVMLRMISEGILKEWMNKDPAECKKTNAISQYHCWNIMCIH